MSDTERQRKHLVPLGAVLDLVSEKQATIHELQAERSTTRLLEAGNEALRAELTRMAGELAKIKARHADAQNAAVTAITRRHEAERLRREEEELLGRVVLAFRNHGPSSPELARAIDAADPELRDTTNKGGVFE